MMEREIIAQLLGNVPQGSIGVLGDFCVDVYWALTPEAGELSLETGLMTTPVSQARYAPGGAGNIVENLRGLNVHDISCFGVVGRDPGCAVSLTLPHCWRFIAATIIPRFTANLC